MATTKLMSVNIQLLTSKRLQKQKHNFGGNMKMKGDDQVYNGVTVKGSMNLSSSSSSTCKFNSAFTFEERLSISKRINSLKKALIKWLKIPAVVLFLMMMMNRRDSAFGKENHIVAHHYKLELREEQLAIKSRLKKLKQQEAREKQLEDEAFELLIKLPDYILFICVICLYLPCFLMDFKDEDVLDVRRRRIHITNLQVGMLVTEPSFKRVLNEITKTADTSIASGRRYMLAETVKALLENFLYCNAANSYVKLSKDNTIVKNILKTLSVQEQNRFDERAFIKKESTSIWGANEFGSTYVVVTVLVAAEGVTVHNFDTTINNKKDLKRTLKQLQYISDNLDIHAIHVLWNESSDQECHEVYPLLGYLTE